MQPEMPEAPMEPVEPAMEEPLALPAPSADVMTMTVSDFIAKCKEIDPLVCMGLESFIEKNKDAFGGGMAQAQAPMPAQDLTFSNAIAPPTSPEPAQNFSLDQSPEELNFPAQG